MKIILTQDVDNLGSLGDTIEVKPGYGRNYLIPQGFALLATGKSSKELRHRLEHLEKLRQGKIAVALEQAEKLKTLKLEVTRKAGPGGRLFGSVNNRDINLLLKENNFELNRRAIQLNAPIREIGNHEFYVRVHSEVSVSMQVKVKGEIEELPVENESEDTLTGKNESEKPNESLKLDENIVENESEKPNESLKLDENIVENESEILQEK